MSWSKTPTLPWAILMYQQMQESLHTNLADSSLSPHMYRAIKKGLAKLGHYYDLTKLNHFNIIMTSSAYTSFHPKSFLQLQPFSFACRIARKRFWLWHGSGPQMYHTWIISCLNITQQTLRTVVNYIAYGNIRQYTQMLWNSQQLLQVWCCGKPNPLCPRTYPANSISRKLWLTKKSVQWDCSQVSMEARKQACVL